MFDLITIEELATFLKTSKSTIYGWVTNNKIPQMCIFDKLGSTRIKKTQFEKYYNVDIKNLLTPDELADILKIKKKTITVWFARKILPKEMRTKIVGINRYRKDVLEKFINEELTTVA